jgi:hypothetical protein
VDEEFPDPSPTTATRAGSTLASNANEAGLHFRFLFHRS